MGKRDTYSTIPQMDVETVDAEVVNPVKSSSRNVPRKRGASIKCCLCLILQLILVAIFIVILVGSIVSYQWYRWMSKEVQHWTVTEPNTAIPTINVNEEELSLFKERAKMFYDSIEGGMATSDFVVTADNLNGLAASSDFLAGNAFAELTENQAQVSFSLPVDYLPGGRGRFLVGTQTVTWNPETSIVHATLDLSAESLETILDVELKLTQEKDEDSNEDMLRLELVSGKALDWWIPQEMIDEHHNLLEDLYHCDIDEDGCKHAHKFLERLTGISLETDQIVFHVDPESSNDDDDEEEEEEEEEDLVRRSLRKGGPHARPSRKFSQVVRKLLLAF